MASKKQLNISNLFKLHNFLIEHPLLYAILLNIFRRNFAFQGSKKQLKMIRKFLDNNSFSAFVETGTHRGDTIYHLARNYVHLPFYSCEINPKLYKISIMRTKKLENVHIFNCDSRYFLEKFSRYFGEHPFFFWDAHNGKEGDPIEEELKIINSKFKKGVIWVDNIYTEGGLEKLKSLARNHTIYSFDHF